MSSGISFNPTITVEQIHTNIQTSIIIITEDKLENAVNKHLEGCKSKDKWATPAGILVSLIIMFNTSEFKQSFGVSKESWQGFFMFLSLAVFVWLFLNLFDLVKNWGLSSNHLITSIKNASVKDSKSEQVGSGDGVAG